MEDTDFLYGVYQANELYPARWMKSGHFLPQDPGVEFKTALDLILT